RPVASRFRPRLWSRRQSRWRLHAAHRSVSGYPVPALVPGMLGPLRWYSAPADVRRITPRLPLPSSISIRNTATADVLRLDDPRPQTIEKQWPTWNVLRLHRRQDL